MLAELTITNFAIIERLHLRFAPGFNVFTGETGAGKSIIIDAVSMLLGGRADTTMIRTDAKLSTIEGIFYLSPEERVSIDLLLAQDALESEDPDTLVLAREIRISGHNVCRVNGRAVRLSILESIGQYLIDIHGQSEHLSLLNERSHLDFLDRYAGLEADRASLASQARELRAVRRELDDLLRSERQLQQRADLLRYQVDEIGSANLEPGEDEELVQERTRLANAERLAEITSEALSFLADGDEEQTTAVDLLGQASRALANLIRIDPQMNAVHQRIEEIEYELNDLVGALQDYQEETEHNPGRLNQVEERLALIRRLQHKYGDTIPEILTFGQQAADELDKIEHSGERIAELQTLERQHLLTVGKLGAALSAARREAGQKLSTEVESELGELRMEGARFAVDIQWLPAEDGAVVESVPEGLGQAPGRYAFDEKGLDRVGFMLAANVGEDLKPMAKVASGGETSRLMLALKTALAQADRIPTLIFDEIDQGIGGRVGGIVGSKLRALSQALGEDGRQVFCVTHLPQLAGFGDIHLHVRKSVSEGRTRTIVEPLEGEARVSELAQMLGGDSEATKKIARELLTQKP